ncbi:hypothetical protein QLQ15_06860 [Lysobacter sp. LF1]|uniref:Uncharacterized protein n=1 Tax=Lysobacter stagni TaxID=3045172 RepID=A0ABT6XER5_9GAMM|nr:hypothetical protein [Lysobacter sp. LF1]MDI9238635.1 hypothetical protein [Lysobacter sp. LF1]
MQAAWIVTVTSLLATGICSAAEFNSTACGNAREDPADAVFVPEAPGLMEEGRSTGVKGIDADGDGRDDEVVLWRSYSDSRFPGDNQQITYKPSGGREIFRAEFPVIALLKRGSEYYVQGLTYEYPNLPMPGMTQIDVLKLDRSGLVAICTRRTPTTAG